MNKTYKTYLVLLGVIIVILALLELNKKPVIDWSLNYDVNKKSPFGLYIFDQESDKLFDNQLKRVDENPYLYLERDTLRKPQNYLLIQKDITKEAENYLLKEVEKGSSVFYILNKKRHSSYHQMYRYPFKDTLHFEPSYLYINYSTKFRFTDKKLKNREVSIDKSFEYQFFKKVNNKTTEILGHRSNIDVCFIKVNYGKGSFYFLSQPLLLTNYYLKEKKNQKAIEALFSYLPKRKTIWFQDEISKTSRSEMQFILKHPALRSAWYLVIVTLLLFVFFNAKRRQRIIPIINPKPNKSVEFIKNIGNLYLQEGNAHDMAQKKVQYFLNKIRNELYLSTNYLDREFAKKLQQKTGKSIEDIEKGLQLINNVLQPKKPISEKELIELNRVLDKIYM